MTQRDFEELPIAATHRVDGKLRDVWIGQFDGTAIFEPCGDKWLLDEIQVKSLYRDGGTLVLFHGCLEHDLFARLERALIEHYPHWFRRTPEDVAAARADHINDERVSS